MNQKAGLRIGNDKEVTRTIMANKGKYFNGGKTFHWKWKNRERSIFGIFYRNNENEVGKANWNLGNGTIRIYQIII